MATIDLFESEAGSSSELPPSADQPVIDPGADAAVKMDTGDTRDWLRTISSTMASLKNSFEKLAKQKKCKKEKQTPEVEFSSAEER